MVGMVEASGGRACRTTRAAANAGRTSVTACKKAHMQPELLLRPSLAHIPLHLRPTPALAPLERAAGSLFVVVCRRCRSVALRCCPPALDWPRPAVCSLLAVAGAVQRQELLPRSAAAAAAAAASVVLLLRCCHCTAALPLLLSSAPAKRPAAPVLSRFAIHPSYCLSKRAPVWLSSPPEREALCAFTRDHISTGLLHTRRGLDGRLSSSPAQTVRSPSPHGRIGAAHRAALNPSPAALLLQVSSLRERAALTRARPTRRPPPGPSSWRSLGAGSTRSRALRGLWLARSLLLLLLLLLLLAAAPARPFARHPSTYPQSLPIPPIHIPIPIPPPSPILAATHIAAPHVAPLARPPLLPWACLLSRRPR
jgi:hypothetical protein